MYESRTYESILNDMLANVPSSMDKREGSVIYDAVAPCAVELAIMYIELDVILKETFGDTASREYLIRRASERGLAPNGASYAVLKGEFNIGVPVGARFSCGELNYIVTEMISEFEYMVQCETVGVLGNKNFGKLIPIDYIDGLTSALLTDLLIPGEDEEDTEDFRERYFASFDSKAYGGNVADYLEKTNSIAGVGATKVTPVWNGGGTVRLTILNSEFDMASDVLIDSVQQEIDPTRDGCGIGIAPIGHIVTVDTVEQVATNINTRVVCDVGYSYSQIESSILEVLDGYLLDLRKEWGSSDSCIVRIAQIESKIMGVAGVLDISSTTVNGSGDNLVLGEYQVPILGELVADE